MNPERSIRLTPVERFLFMVTNTHGHTHALAGGARELRLPT